MTGRPITAADVETAHALAPDDRTWMQHIADELNRIARGVPERGDDEPRSGNGGNAGACPACAGGEPHEPWTDEDAENVETALRAADADQAGHWPTVAGWLACEVRRLRAGSLPAMPPEVTEALEWVRARTGSVDDLVVGAAGSGTRNNAATVVRWALSLPDQDERAASERVASGVAELAPDRLRDTDQGSEWQPGDPVYPEQDLSGRRHCGPCLVAWTADVDRCPECGQLSTEALRAELAEARAERVVEGEPPAPEPQAAEPPFAEGDRVRVKSTGRTGVLREIDSRGRHLIFGDDESWITGVRADNLDPAPEPRGYRKGFDDGVKYARDIDRTIARMTVPAAPVDEAHRYAEGYDPHETGSLLVDIRAAWLAGHRAALAAAGAVRVEDDK